MTTLDQLVAQVRQNLQGFSLTQESMTVLMADMAPGDITFQADGETITDLSAGIAEIDDELVLVQKWDQLSGTVTVLGGERGRGYAATTAAAHTAGALVTSAPAYPRARVKEAINRAIEALYPHLVCFGELDFPYVSAQLEYPLPTEATDIWYVTGRWVGPEKISGAVANWRYNPKAYGADFPTGKSLQVFDSITPGQNVRVIYTKRPETLSLGTDVFADVTGYEDRIADLVVWDATKRLLPSALPARLQQQAIESTERSMMVASRDIAAAVQLYAGLYAERLADERNRQFTEAPNYAAFMGS